MPNDCTHRRRANSGTGDADIFIPVTNVVESMISICREHAKNVKHWQDGQMALRWCAAGMVEAGKQFRRVNGHLHLLALRAELQRVTAETVVPDRHRR
jgi:putative transposase